MAWPQTAIVTDEPVTTVGLNGLPVMIANTTLGADSASIDFTSIPQHYAHLIVECYLRGSQALTTTGAFIRLNGDTGGNYDYQTLVGLGTTATAAETFAATAALFATIPGSSAPANVFGADRFKIPHYAQAANNKCAVSKIAAKGGTSTGTLFANSYVQFWRSSAAVTQVTLIPSSGNFVTGSRATLYGLP